MKKKLLVFYADTRGTGFYRCVTPYLELHRRGDFDVKLSALTDPNDILKADVVVLQRQHHDPTMAGVLTAKKFRKVVISENDDYLFAMPDYNLGEGAVMIRNPDGTVETKSSFSKDSENMKTLKKVYQCSSALSLSTPNLVKLHEPDNAVRYCLPNFIDEKFIRKVPQAVDRASIMWAGASSHERDIVPCTFPLRRFFKDRPDAEFQNVGVDYRIQFCGGMESRYKFHKSPWDSTQAFLNNQFYEQHNVHNIDKQNWRALWSFDGWEGKGHQVLGIRLNDAHRVFYPIKEMYWEVEAYYDVLAKTGANINLAPLCENVFNSCKSWLRVLESAMLGIPTIASDWGQYHEIIASWDPYTAKRDPNAFAIKADNHGDWYKSLVMLSNSVPLRDRMSNKAIEWAKTKTIQKNAHLWTDMINELIEKNKEVKAA